MPHDTTTLISRKLLASLANYLNFLLFKCMKYLIASYTKITVTIM